MFCVLFVCYFYCCVNCNVFYCPNCCSYCVIGRPPPHPGLTLCHYPHSTMGILHLKGNANTNCLFKHDLRPLACIINSASYLTVIQAEMMFVLCGADVLLHTQCDCRTGEMKRSVMQNATRTLTHSSKFHYSKSSEALVRSQTQINSSNQCDARQTDSNHTSSIMQKGNIK